MCCFYFDYRSGENFVLYIVLVFSKQLTSLIIKFLIFFTLLKALLDYHVSGFVTSLDTPAKLDCPYGRNGPPSACCIDVCNSNCGTECLRKGFQKGGQCPFQHGSDRCCCFI